jgi:hypothetical protein
VIDEQGGFLLRITKNFRLSELQINVVWIETVSPNAFLRCGRLIFFTIRFGY